MDYVLDHVVHAVSSPGEALRAMKQHGLHAVQGGSHLNWGTYNALCYFDLSYIEFLGIEDIKKASLETANDLATQTVQDLKDGDGFIRIALRTYQIQTVADILRGEGIQAEGPFRGERRRPDGSLLTWTLLFPKCQEGELPLPFFIEWDESDEERRKDLREKGSMKTHPLGELRISEVGFAVKSLEQTMEKWSHFLDSEAGEPMVDDVRHARVNTIPLPNVKLKFYEPVGTGQVQDTLRTRGERPFLITLSGSNQGTKEMKLLGGIYRFT